MKNESFYPQNRRTWLALPWTSTRWWRSATKTTASPSPCTSMSSGMNPGWSWFPQLGLPSDPRTQQNQCWFPQVWILSRTSGCQTLSYITWKPSNWLTGQCRSFPDCGLPVTKNWRTARPPTSPSSARWSSTSFPSTPRSANSVLGLTISTAQKCSSSQNIMVEIFWFGPLDKNMISWFQDFRLRRPTVLPLTTAYVSGVYWPVIIWSHQHVVSIILCFSVIKELAPEDSVLDYGPLGNFTIAGFEMVFTLISTNFVPNSFSSCKVMILHD